MDRRTHRVERVHRRQTTAQRPTEGRRHGGGPRGKALLVLLSTLGLAITGLGPPVAAQRAPAAESLAPVGAELEQSVADAEDGERVRAVLMLPNAAQLGAPDEVVAQLRQYAEETQAEVARAFEHDEQPGSGVAVVNSLWITNAMLVEFPADAQVLRSLAAMPGVRRIIPNFELTVIEPERDEAQRDETDAQIVGDVTWGIDRIEADRVWDELGLTGTGVRVATLDTGVDLDHPDLEGKMLTDDASDPSYPGGWMEFDGSGNLVSSEPRDSGTHGTHVSGTIHGGNASGVAIGVAPDAGMMHGMVIPGGSGSFTQVAAGMQWAIAPTDADGNPAGEPADVVNMSLGVAGYYDEMIAPTEALRAAGAVPAFAIGNQASDSCGVGSSSPGNVYSAIGVGATDDTDTVADFSCGNIIDTDAAWGDAAPDYWPANYVTPDLSAPGVMIWSAQPGGGYASFNGTSMATPHVAGASALMLSAAPELSVDQLQNALEGTSFWDDRHGEERPNTYFGHGRINAYEATLTIGAAPGQDPAVERLDGANRYATSVEIAQEAYPDSATVVIASGEQASLVDGLVAAPLARHLGAPVLLTQRDVLPGVVADEITRRDATTAVLVGGPLAIGEDVATELADLGLTVEREFGQTRWATAAAVAEEVGGTEAVIASGRDTSLVDALGASGPAARAGSPILLVDFDRVPDATADALADYTSTVVAGGPLAITDDVLDALPDPTRVSGDNRYATAAAVATHFVADGIDATSVAIASGRNANIVDALAGGALGEVTLLTFGDTLPDVTHDWLQGSTATTEAYVLGGELAVPAAVADEVAVLLAR